MLSVSNLVIGYGADAVARDLSFSLKAGEILAIIGHNGSGKSTLVKTILGIEQTLAGTLMWTGASTGARAVTGAVTGHVGATGARPAPLGYLGQLTEFDRRFPMRVCDLVATGAWSQLGFFDAAGRSARRQADVALDRVGLRDIATLPLHKLSAGQLQRALFARTIVQDAQVIILDEPFAAVDQNTEAELMQHVLDWAAEGRAVIMVLHSLSAALAHCQNTLLLGRGIGRFGASEQVLTPETLVEMDYLSADQSLWMSKNTPSTKAGARREPEKKAEPHA